MDHKKVSDWL